MSQIEGIDVSYAQGSVYWDAVRADGRPFAFCKVSEGNTVPDPTWSQARVRALREARVIFGVYHFGRPSQAAATDGASECARFFQLATSAGWGRHGDLPGVLDIEAADPGVTYLNAQRYTRSFVRHYRKLAKQHGFHHRHPIIYTGSFWRDFMRNPIMVTRCKLWLAAYVDKPRPYTPRAFKRITFWQYRIGTCRGVGGQVDLDRFFGSLKHLRKLTI